MNNINLNELKVIDREYNLESGFFWVEFEDGGSLQCCLKAKHDGLGYEAQIDTNNTGFDQGLSWNNNKWASHDDSECEHIDDFLLEQAQKVGLQLIA